MGEFNEAQVAAIRHKKGPMLVLAGAGSGKTTVLTYRIKKSDHEQRSQSKEHFSAYIYKGSSKRNGRTFPCYDA